MHMQNSTLFLLLGYSIPYCRIDFSVLCHHSHVIHLYTFTPFVQPFPLLVLWLLLTSDDSVVHRCTGFPLWVIHQISQGKSAHFPLIYLPHLLPHLSEDILDFSFFCNLIQMRQPHAIRVPQTKIFPRTSFRFRVTTDTLVFS